MGCLTGVGGTFCASHLTHDGKLHGHSYEVIAWFRPGSDAGWLQKQLNAVLAGFDHSVLSDENRWGEQLAELIAINLPGAVKVEVRRPLERIYAEWSA